MSEGSTALSPVELTHRAYADLNTRDLDAITGLLGPDCVCDLSRWDLGVHTGPPAIRRFAADWLGRLYEYGVEVDDVEDLGNGVVYARHVAHRAATSHGYLELPAAAVLVWADGVLTRMTLYSDREEARSAAKQLAESRG